MPTPTEYAVLANAAYRDIRNEQVNLPVKPSGWTSLSRTALGFSDSASSSGFSAEAFKNGTEIVISYQGTNSDPFTKDGYRDWTENTRLFLGWASTQMKEAALFYQRVVAQNPGANITFTGHSLGGGLAGLMAIYFERKAVVFDSAPFQGSASAANARVLRDYLATQSPAYVDAALNQMVTGDFGALFQTRKSGVTGHYLQNEILAALRNEGNTIGQWPQNQVVIGDTQLGRVGLHSQQLLAASMTSTSLREASIALPSLLALVADTSLYARALKLDQKDFLQKLMEFQFGTERVTASNMLNRFGDDAKKIAKTGLLEVASVRDGAIVGTIEYFNFTPGTDTSAFVEEVTGGIRLDMSRIAITTGEFKGRGRLADYFQSDTYYELLFNPEKKLVNLKEKTEWILQGGADLNATASGTSGAVMIGWTGADMLTGGVGNDVLIGERGDDTIAGGNGSDVLVGGDGDDTYVYADGDGIDFIRDRGQDGKIMFNGVQLKGTDGADPGTVKTNANESGRGEWIVGALKYVYDPGNSNPSRTLEITRVGGDATDKLVIENFNLEQAKSAQGYLGIKLESKKDISIQKGSGANVFKNAASNPDTTLTATVHEGTAQSLRVDFNTFAKAGDKLQLALANQAEATDYSLVIGDATVGFENGPIEITLTEGQTDAGFAFLSDGDITGNESLTLTAKLVEANPEAGSTAVTHSIEINLDAADETGVPDTITSFNVVVGTNNADTSATLRGTSASDDIQGLAGDDVINADEGFDYLNNPLGAPDRLNGGAGRDLIYAGRISDTIIGGTEGDVMFGVEGDDEMYAETEIELDAAITAGDQPGATAGQTKEFMGGGGGDDRMIGGTGADLISGGSGSDTIVAGAGDDIILGDTELIAQGLDWDISSSGFVNIYGALSVANQGADVIYAGAGSDQIAGEGGDDFIDAGSGNDYADGHEGDDVILGGSGDDQLGGDVLQGDAAHSHITFAMHGQDFLDGGEGADTLIGGGNSDTLYGGAGDDYMVGDDTIGYLAAAYGGEDYMDGEDGDDTLIGGAKADTLYGGAGNDTLDGDDAELGLAEQADDYIDGEDGDDEIIGRGGSDTLYGGAGDDTIRADEGDDYADGEDGADKLYLGEGDDTAFGGAGKDVIQLGDGDDTADGEEDDDQIFGEDGDDTAFGGAGNDELVMGDGNDSADGEAGDDKLFGQGGDDDLSGGDGADQISAGAGFDSVSGGAGNDVILLGTDDDTASGGEGDDQIFAEAGNDSVEGDDGDDVLVMGDGDDTADGGAGADQLFGDAGDDALTGGAGADQLVGGAGNDALDGGDADDRLFGQEGSDSLDGGAGNDVLVAGTGDDEVSGGDGDDIYVYSAGDGADTISDTGGTADVLIIQGYTSTQVALENAEGASVGLRFSATDVLVVDEQGSGIDFVQFSDGVFTMAELFGRGVTSGGTDGTDFNDGTTYNDTISTGAGDDVVVAGAGIDTIDLGSGSDYADGGEGNDAISAGAGDDTVVAGAGNDAISLGEGNDLADGGDGADYIDAGAGNDEAFGGNGADVISGGEGLDALHGGAGSDNLAGGNGADTLSGDADADQLAGGNGNDTYLFARGDGFDTLFESDLTAGNTDTLRFAADIASAQVRVSRNADDLVVRLDDNSGGATIQYYFLGGATGANLVERIEFGDGAVWSYANVLAQLLNGTEGNDTITGTASDDTIDGRGGFDTIFGLGGNDTLLGGSGNDTVRGDAGTDAIYGGSGFDKLYGGSGSDTLTGGADFDQLFGGGGSDTYVVAAGDGSDTIGENVESAGALTSDVDTLRLVGVSPGAVTLRREFADLMVDFTSTESVRVANHFYSGLPQSQIEQVVFDDGTIWDSAYLQQNLRIAGTSGDDTIFGSTAGDTINGGAGFDNLYGMEGNDTLAGGLSTDTLWGGAGDDTYLFNLGDGNDSIYDAGVYAGSGGNDTLIFGAGITPGSVALTKLSNDSGYRLTISGTNDSVTLLAGSDALLNPGVALPERIVFADGTIWTDDTIAKMFPINGTAGADTLVGTASADYIYGFAGNDTIRGGSGNDVIDGGSGSDTIYGEDGNDTLLGGTGDASRANALNNLYGGNGNDVLISGGNTSVMQGNYGGAGNDIYRGGAGGDRQEDDGGNNLYIGGAGADQHWLSEQSEVVIGGDGADLIYGDRDGDRAGGADILLYNKGDGDDSVLRNSSGGVLSIGGGALYSNLKLVRSADKLTLNVGSQGVSFSQWYDIGFGALKSISTLQIVIEGTRKYNAASIDPLYNKKIQTFDFLGLVAAFDTAQAAGQRFTLADRLAQFRTGGSDTAAYGGVLAYQYATTGSVDSLSNDQVRAILGDPGLGSSMLPVTAGAALAASALRLADSAALDTDFAVTATVTSTEASTVTPAASAPATVVDDGSAGAGTLTTANPVAAALADLPGAAGLTPAAGIAAARLPELDLSAWIRSAQSPWPGAEFVAGDHAGITRRWNAVHAAMQNLPTTDETNPANRWSAPPVWSMPVLRLITGAPGSAMGSAGPVGLTDAGAFSARRFEGLQEGLVKLG